MAAKLLIIAAFLIQTVIVFGGNSRLFGLLQPGSGWYTNVEMSQRYASLVQPAKWAFAIWGIIYTWEVAAMCYLVLRPEGTITFWHDSSSLYLWVAANIFQGVWALLFATERLTLAALALAGIATSLIMLSFSLRTASALEYCVVVAPFWLHAGWTTAASIVNVNLVVGLTADAATQLAAACASALFACAFGLGVVIIVTGDALTASPLIATPFVCALCWALAAIRAELKNPVLIVSSAAYAEIGEVGRRALQLVVSGCALVVVGGSIAVVAPRLVGERAWLELK